MSNVEGVFAPQFSQLEWTHPPIPDDLPDALVAEAKKVRRKELAAGHAGFFASHVQMPAGQHAEPHSHDHGELMIVMEGSMTLSAGEQQRELTRYDSVAIPAGTVYDFTVGSDGVSFLLIRGGKAVSTLANQGGEG